MNDRSITKKQISHIHTLISRLGLKQEHIEIIEQYTSGRTCSSANMTMKEASTLIEDLHARQPKKVKEDYNEDESNLMRRKIISCLRQYGFVYKDKADMQKIYAWVRNYGYLKKDLNKYTFEELPKLVTQAEAMITKKVNSNE